jgi:hypothetical protein
MDQQGFPAPGTANAFPLYGHDCNAQASRSISNGRCQGMLVRGTLLKPHNAFDAPFLENRIGFQDGI